MQSVCDWSNSTSSSSAFSSIVAGDVKGDRRVRWNDNHLIPLPLCSTPKSPRRIPSPLFEEGFSLHGQDISVHTEQVIIAGALLSSRSYSAFLRDVKGARANKCTHTYSELNKGKKIEADSRFNYLYSFSPSSGDEKRLYCSLVSTHGLNYSTRARNYRCSSVREAVSRRQEKAPNPLFQVEIKELTIRRGWCGFGFTLVGESPAKVESVFEGKNRKRQFISGQL